METHEGSILEALLWRTGREQSSAQKESRTTEINHTNDDATAKGFVMVDGCHHAEKSFLIVEIEEKEVLKCEVEVARHVIARV